MAPNEKIIPNTYRLTVSESHLDDLGHMNHAIYLMLFEKARAEMVTLNGYSYLLKIQETGISPIYLEVNLKFRKELILGQAILIETEVISYSKRIAVIAQYMKDAEGTLYCSAKFKFGLFDLKKRKLIAPTSEWIKALGLSPKDS